LTLPRAAGEEDQGGGWQIPAEFPTMRPARHIRADAAANGAVKQSRETPMSAIDIAKRVYDHTWKLDPIVRSLLDTDFYKLLMLQMIWGRYPDVNATFSLINRTRRVRIADEIDERE